MKEQYSNFNDQNMTAKDKQSKKTPVNSYLKTDAYWWIETIACTWEIYTRIIVKIKQ